ncbi:MAG TPA: ATP-binding protein [Bryobacteraceae bacterium]|nr:ATP-binding protein [Bryobacteraceae bacterium]
MSEEVKPAPQVDEPMDPATLEAELQTANRKLAEAHKMASLGRLAAGIVHEINTPIGSILSNNETTRRSLDAIREQLIAGDCQVPAKALKLLDSVATLASVDKIACERIYGVIRSLKTFARVNEGDLRKMDVRELLDSTIKLSSSVYRSRIAVDKDYGADVPEVECYPGLLNQVFLNLIVNASQAIENEGTITVTTRLEGDRVHIAVSDTGSGIPAEVRPKIFAAGFTTKPFGEGTGLGLTITREIVEDTHGGAISFETDMDNGTTFHVRIPVVQPRAADQQSEQTRQESS